jgi:quercetin dioxygenase-like cupin family protein
MPSGISARFAHLVRPEDLETIDVFGPTIQFITSPSETNAPCIMRGTIPPGVSIPLHSHADPETFVLLSGTVEGLVCRQEDFEWLALHPDDVLHVPPNARHAWRNNGRAPATMLIISTATMGRFFQEVGMLRRPGAPPRVPSSDDLQRFMRTSARYGYWNATPEENAQVGIVVPPAAATGV